MQPEIHNLIRTFPTQEAKYDLTGSLITPPDIDPVETGYEIMKIRIISAARVEKITGYLPNGDGTYREGDLGNPEAIPYM